MGGWGGWLGEINIKAKLSPAELKLGLSLAILRQNLSVEEIQSLNHWEFINKQNLPYQSTRILTDYVRLPQGTHGGNARQHRHLPHRFKKLLDICKKNI